MPGTEYLKNSDSQIELLEVSLGTGSVQGDMVSFCIDVINIKEILRRTEITKMPNLPDGIYGIINYRNTIIPVLDLSKIVLGTENSASGNLVIISEFMEMKFAFTIRGAGEIFRVASDKIELPENRTTDGINLNSLYAKTESGGKSCFIVDIEYIISNTNFKKALAYDNMKLKLPDGFSAFLVGSPGSVKEIVREKLIKAGIITESINSFNNIDFGNKENFTPNVIICFADLNDADDIKAIEKLNNYDVSSKIPLIIIPGRGFDNVSEPADIFDSAYILSEARFSNIIEIIHKLKLSKY